MINKKIIALSSIALATLLTTACANKQPSVLPGAFGVPFSQNAGELSVTGYNDEHTMLTINPPAPNALFQSYNVGVDPKNGKIERISAIGEIEDQTDCLEKQTAVFDALKNQQEGNYRKAGNIDKNTKFLGFDDGVIYLSCKTDLTIDYIQK